MIILDILLWGLFATVFILTLFAITDKPKEEEPENYLDLKHYNMTRKRGIFRL